MAAPTAPPPRARPPPTMAPASWIACWVVSCAIAGLLCWLRRDRLGAFGDQAPQRAGPPGHVVPAHRGVEVEDREQGEDERLDRPDEEVEQLPDRVDDHDHDVADGCSGQ